MKDVGFEKSSEHKDKFEKEHGQNVVMRVYFKRHSEYEKETGSLSPEGKELIKKDAEQLKLSGRGERYRIKGYSSKIPRARETVEAIIDEVNSDRKGVNQVSLGLGRPEEDFHFGDLEEFLEGKEGQKDDIKISSKELAARVAERLNLFVWMSDKLKNDSRVDLINVTHLPWILAFLKELGIPELEEINPDGKTFLERVGGIDYLEGFELIVDRKARKDVSIALKFKDKEVLIPQEKLFGLTKVLNKADERTK